MLIDLEIYSLFVLYTISYVICEFNPLSDNILYNLNWPGPLQESELDTVSII